MKTFVTGANLDTVCALRTEPLRPIVQSARCLYRQRQGNAPEIQTSLPLELPRSTLEATLIRFFCPLDARERQRYRREVSPSLRHPITQEAISTKNVVSIRNVVFSKDTTYHYSLSSHLHHHYEDPASQQKNRVRRSRRHDPKTQMEESQS